MPKEDRRKSREETGQHECHQNPYPKPDPPGYGGGGISLPLYYQPMDSINNNNLYFPGTEILPTNEMRVTFLGSSPWPPSNAQKGTSMMVELGNCTASPRRFFFELGNGSVGHAIAMQVPVPEINDIFISHLHVDHYADLPYMYPFRAYAGGFTPLRVYGPSGRIPELGIAEMVKNMRAMNRWHEENFRCCPVGDGFEIKVREFDYKKAGGRCYDVDGVKVIHWPRSHVKDGASAYRLDWEDAGLSFVWTGDGRPDELTLQYAQGADVFVAEGTIDTPRLSGLKVGAPSDLWEYTMDICHTPYYAAGYLMKQVWPRIGAICHFEWSGDAMMAESVAEVRCNFDGLFMFGMDLQVINVTKEKIWCREAVLGKDAAPASAIPPEGAEVPPVTFPRELQMDHALIDGEIDPHLYYPEQVYRDPTTVYGDFNSSWLKQHIEENRGAAPPIDVKPLTPSEMLKAKGIDPEIWKKYKK